MKTYSNKSSVDPAKEKSGVMKGSGQTLKRNKKGSLVAERSADFAGQSNESMAGDRKRAAGKGDGSISGGPAPRVGGAPYKPSTGMATGGSKKQMKDSIRRIRKSDASPQAKKAARRAHGG